MSLYHTLDISASGLAAQRKRVQLLAENIANAETTQTPAGGPYRRKRAIFEARPVDVPFATRFRQARIAATRFGEPAKEGVSVARVEADPTPPVRRYLPDHPHADPEGYVEFPPFNPVEDMVDLTAAVRSYQANLAVASAVKEMINRTIEIAR